jgi:hypothetical protein
MKLAYALLFSLLSAPARAAGSAVDVQIAWDLKDLPGATMTIHETDPKHPVKLWQMGSGSDPSKLPFGPEIGDSKIQVQRGGHKRFVLVLTNSGDKPLYFFAAPHQVTPPELALGFKFKCLCINHAFKVGPKETWYRVVELRISDGYEGKGMQLKHTVIGITEDRMKHFSMPIDESGNDS